jgi:uncharacterized protein (TIGR03435 family)
VRRKLFRKPLPAVSKKDIRGRRVALILPRALVSAGRRGGDPNQPGAAVSAADPTGDITAFETVDKFLGLKLAEQKYPMSVIAIDHVDRTPTEN